MHVTLTVPHVIPKLTFISQNNYAVYMWKLILWQRWSCYSYSTLKSLKRALFAVTYLLIDHSDWWFWFFEWKADQTYLCWLICLSEIMDIDHVQWVWTKVFDHKMDQMMIKVKIKQFPCRQQNSPFRFGVTLELGVISAMMVIAIDLPLRFSRIETVSIPHLDAKYTVIIYNLTNCYATSDIFQTVPETRHWSRF